MNKQPEPIFIKYKEKMRFSQYNGLFSSARPLSDLQSLQRPKLNQYKEQQSQKKFYNYQFISKDELDNRLKNEQNLTNKQIIYIQPNFKDLHIGSEGQIDDRKYQCKVQKFNQQKFANLRIEWRRIQRSKYQVYRQKISPYDIKQGILGNCYFLSALAALAENPQRIRNLFQTQQNLTSNNQFFDKLSYFSVKILCKGKWKIIQVDNQFAYIGNQLLFAQFVKPEEQKWWVQIIQKAWAKIYGGYIKTQGGYPEQALHDLTGAPVKQIQTAHLTGIQQVANWNSLVWSYEKGYAMVASSRKGAQFLRNDIGIIQGHAYTLLGAFNVKLIKSSQQDSQEMKIVKLRNPWSNHQYAGEWSDDSQMWENVLKSQKKRIGYQNNKNDGIFFMSLEQFRFYFICITIAQINDNASYVNESIFDRNSEGAFFTIQILKQGYYSFQVDKTPQRQFDLQIQRSYEYPLAIIQIGRIESKQIIRVSSTPSSKRTLFVGQILKPGTYIAFVKIQFSQEFEIDYQVNLAVYSEYCCKIMASSKKQVILFTGNLSHKWNPEQRYIQESQHRKKMQKQARKRGANQSRSLQSSRTRDSQSYEYNPDYGYGKKQADQHTIIYKWAKIDKNQNYRTWEQINRAEKQDIERRKRKQEEQQNKIIESFAEEYINPIRTTMSITKFIK